jgi:glycosyltransferase involved in cell wall biosynthesis
MNVLIINYECPPLGGGGGISCYQISRELANAHHIDYLTTGNKELPRSEVREGINIFRVPVIGRKNLSTASLLSMISFFPISLFKGIHLCATNNYDVINAHFVIPSGLPAAIIAKIFRKPLVISVHGGDIYDPSKKWSPHRHATLRLIIKWVLKQADCVVAQSNNTKENLTRYYKFHGQIKIIPLGFFQPQFLRVTRKNLGVPENQIIFISVGRLVKRKGYEYAIRALSELADRSFHYFIIGDGPEEGDLKNLAITLGLEKNVTFLGYLPEEQKFQYLAVSDIYLLPSIHEGFGICLLEAMHCGLPIISTDNGGQVDLLKDYVNALFSEAQNSDAFSKKIRELLADENLRMALSSNNRRDIANFYIEEISNIYENLYRVLIKKRSNEGLHENR